MNAHALLEGGKPRISICHIFSSLSLEIFCPCRGCQGGVLRFPGFQCILGVENRRWNDMARGKPFILRSICLRNICLLDFIYTHFICLIFFRICFHTFEKTPIKRHLYVRFPHTEAKKTKKTTPLNKNDVIFPKENLSSIDCLAIRTFLAIKVGLWVAQECRGARRRGHPCLAAWPTTSRYCKAFRIAGLTRRGRDPSNTM